MQFNANKIVNISNQFLVFGAFLIETAIEEIATLSERRNKPCHSAVFSIYAGKCVDKIY